MNYPPIPPNCPYFEIGGSHDGRLVYFRVSGQECAILNPDRPNTHTQLSFDLKRWRPIIAAVAEVAWRKLTMKDAPKEWSAFRDKHAGDVEVCWDFFRVQNAVAWRAWGEQK